MKFENDVVVSGKNILANDHFVAIPYDCTNVTATDGVIPAGTFIPKNDATAIGVLLNDVYPNENPNGTVVVHGFVHKDKLPVAPAGTVAIPLIKFLD